MENQQPIIIKEYGLLVKFLTITFLLVLVWFLYYFYSSFRNIKCDEGYILYSGRCLQEKKDCKVENGTGTQSYASGGNYSVCKTTFCDQGYSLQSGICMLEDNIGTGTNEISTYGTHYLELGGMYSRTHNISDYKKIQINKKIDSMRMIITIDFPARFKEDFSSYTEAKNFGFALKYFLGEWGFNEEGGFYNVLRNSNCKTLGNYIKKGLNGKISGKEINGGHTWIIDLSNNVIIATEKCEPGKQYKTTRSLDFINNHIGKSLYIGAYLSHVGEGKGHGPIKGWEVSLVKNIKIEYIGEEGAISSEK